MSDIQADDTLREWTESARYWEKYSPFIRTMFAPVTAALIEDAGIREGQTLLDVAGGPGEPSLTIAETVGPSGSVICTDAWPRWSRLPSAPRMVAELPTLVFASVPLIYFLLIATRLMWSSGRLGVMFFPDPLSGLCEMLRVTKPRGVLALA